MSEVTKIPPRTAIFTDALYHVFLDRTKPIITERMKQKR